MFPIRIRVLTWIPDDEGDVARVAADPGGCAPRAMSPRDEPRVLDRNEGEQGNGPAGIRRVHRVSGSINQDNVSVSHRRAQASVHRATARPWVPPAGRLLDKMVRFLQYPERIAACPLGALGKG